MAGLAQIKAALAPHALMVAGGVARGAAPLPDGVETLLLLAPDGARFWPHFTASPEYGDGRPAPLDRWSGRVIDALAADFGAQAIYPFGASPPHPFYAWALASGQIFASPVMWLVHPRAGLWLSFRGALGFGTALDLPAPGANPCTGCPRPCVSACPVGALSDKGYDLPACHAFLDSDAGQGCMEQGCAVRAACPISRASGRAPEQSAFHMRHFHP